MNALKDPKNFSVDIQVLRMILCGVARSGKSTFWNRLVNDDFDTEKVSPSTTLAEQHHIHVNFKTAMLYDWHLCGEDDSSTSKNDIDKEILVIYKKILDSYDPHMTRDVTTTPSSTEVALASARNDPTGVHNVRTSAQAPNQPARQQNLPSVHDIVRKEIDSIFRRLEERLTSVGEMPDISTLHQLINLNDIGGQRAFLELLPTVSVGSAFYLIFFSYGNPLNRPLKDRYQGPEKCFDLANECSQIEVVMQSLRCVASTSFGDDNIPIESDASADNNIPNEKKESDTKVAALLVGTHTDTVSDPAVMDEANDCIQKKVIGFLKSETNVLDYASVYPKEQLVLEVNNKTKSKEEFEGYRNVLMQVVNRKFSHYVKKLPGSWLMFSIIVRKMKIAGRSVLQYEHCKYIASKLYIPPTDLDGLLHFMHKDLGILMYFPEIPCLRHVVISDPAAVFTSISEIIIPTFTEDVAKMSTQKFLHFKRYGVFAYRTVNDLTNKKRGSLEAEQLIALLQHLGVIAPIEFSDSEQDQNVECTLDHNHEADSQHCIHSEYIIPCVLKGTTASEDERIEQHCNKNCTIAPMIITFDCNFAPMGGFCYLFTKLLTDKRSNWDPYLPEIHAPGEPPIDRLIRRNKVTFIVDKRFYVSFVATASHFKVFIVRGDSNEQTGYEFVCHEVREAIKNALSSCPNPQVQRFKVAFQCTGHTRDYKHNGHLMVVNQQSMKSPKPTAECEEEQREVPIDTDSLSVMAWFKVKFSGNSLRFLYSCCFCLCRGLSNL